MERDRVGLHHAGTRSKRRQLSESALETPLAAGFQAGVLCALVPFVIA